MSIPNAQIVRFACAAVLIGGVGTMNAQTDPGPRGGPPGAGGKYPTLGINETLFFTQAQTRFQEVDSVSGALPGETGSGLGPAFNGNSCAMCHAQPALGGSSPGLTSKQHAIPNPQVALATLDGANNIVPSFITANGPVREARFVNGANGPDGGVHGIYTIQGRHDAPGCTLAQPDFTTAEDTSNVIFRIPTPTFGLGLVENTPDATLAANLASNLSARMAMGIGGMLNTIGNDGTVTRFGWKAQNKSLLIFAGEAYNVEQGVSNEVFPNERSAVPGCVFNATPEDSTNLVDAQFHLPVGTASAMSSDIVNFAAFARLLAPPAPTTSSPSEMNGQALFGSVGCVLCHSQSLTSAKSDYTGMGNVTYHPYSDFAVHHMGHGLADGVSQGNAGPDEFRTAPLWGAGQRLFFLHDGRTADLLQAIEQHMSSGSEASAVIGQFNALPPQSKQDLLNFLRSL
jgi:CxxC motif-containing protein (DUF1111 family)